MIHISMDAREAMKEYQCQYCPKQFLRRSVLLMHEASHTGEHKYQCDKCPKKFAYSAQCMPSQYKFLFLNSFLKLWVFVMFVAVHKHKKSHSNLREHQCSMCDKSFKFPYKLAQHMITHTKSRKHACDECGQFPPPPIS